VFLARVAVEQSRFDNAVDLLMGVPEDDATRTIGPELRAQVRFWRAQALRGQGNRDAASQELAAARQALQSIHARFTTEGVRRYSARPDIRPLLE
jgi:hypothetical protein